MLRLAYESLVQYYQATDNLPPQKIPMMSDAITQTSTPAEAEYAFTEIDSSVSQMAGAWSYYEDKSSDLTLSNLQIAQLPKLKTDDDESTRQAYTQNCAEAEHTLGSESQNESQDSSAAGDHDSLAQIAPDPTAPDTKAINDSDSAHKVATSDIIAQEADEDPHVQKDNEVATHFVSEERDILASVENGLAVLHLNGREEDVTSILKYLYTTHTPHFANIPQAKHGVDLGIRFGLDRFAEAALNILARYIERIWEQQAEYRWPVYVGLIWNWSRGLDESRLIFIRNTILRTLRRAGTFEAGKDYKDLMGRNKEIRILMKSKRDLQTVAERAKEKAEIEKIIKKFKEMPAAKTGQSSLA